MEKLSQLAATLLDIQNPAYLNWVQLYRCIPLDNGRRFKKGLPDGATPIYYAVRLGLRIVTRLLLDKGDDVNPPGACSWALPTAVAAGDEHIIKMLLDHGIDVNSSDKDGSSALRVASSGGYEQICKMLLEYGANVNARGVWDETALQGASEFGHENIVMLLLDKGAEFNMHGKEWDNAEVYVLHVNHEGWPEFLRHKFMEDDSIEEGFIVESE